MSFVGGKLNLKGAPAGGVKKKKKGKSKDRERDREPGSGGEAPAADGAGSAGEKARLEGAPVAPPPPGADRRTEAERRRDEKMAKLEDERLRKLAAKGYRDRVKDFNEHLASLSEHHDIPKVGPG